MYKARYGFILKIFLNLFFCVPISNVNAVLSDNPIGSESVDAQLENIFVKDNKDSNKKNFQDSKYKIIAFTVLAGSLVGVGGYFLWKKLIRDEKKRGGIDTQNKDSNSKDSVSFKGMTAGNGGKVITINKPVQLKALQQKGLTCGFHAFRNALYLMLFNDQKEIEKRTMSDENWNEWLQEMQKLVKEPGYIHSNAMQTLLNEDNLSRWEKYIKVETFKQKIKELTNNIEVVDNSMDLRTDHSVNEDIIRKVTSLRDKGEPQCIILNSNGHWYAIKIEKDKKSDSFGVLVTNSCASDRTSDPNLQNIIDFYIKDEIMTLDMLNIQRLTEDCDNILKKGSGSREAREEKLKEIDQIATKEKYYENRLFQEKCWPNLYRVLMDLN